jgi:diamine N-acetyltransferase
MSTIVLRDIVTDEDRAMALTVEVRPEQHEFVPPVARSFREAIEDARACPRMWTAFDGETPVGFAMISDGIPADVLAADPHLMGPYYLWRLMVDRRYQRHGYGTAILDAVVAYVRTRPGADHLLTSCSLGEGTPLPFYERYGFVATGRYEEGEPVLRLDLITEDP